jgi:hypothetical protein
VKGRYHSEDLGIDGKLNIRTNLKQIGWESVDWIHQAQDRYQWWAPINMVMDLQVP